MIRPILVVGNPVLRHKAKKVSQMHRPIQKLIDDMIETMKVAPGVGLAAPQIGVPLRLAVIDVDDKITVIVNPEIVKRVGEVELDEGCLSVPGFWGRLNRAEKVSVKALDRHGKELRIRDAEGLFAQALQHELEHTRWLLKPAPHDAACKANTPLAPGKTGRPPPARPAAMRASRTRKT